MPILQERAKWSNSITELGFALIPEVFSSEQAAILAGVFSEPQVNRTRAGIRHALAIPKIAEAASDTRLLEIARTTLGEGAFPFRATLFDKSPASNWLVAWHQDTALPLRERREVPGWGPWSIKEGILYAHAPAEVLCRVLALRLHLDESANDNGPLRVLPGTHNRGVLTDGEIHELSERIEPVDCLSPAGGVVAMRPLVVHASSKSRTRMPRRVLHIEYAASAVLAGGLELAVA